MNLELFGDLVLVLLILATPVIFAVANANYLPDKTERDEDISHEEAKY